MVPPRIWLVGGDADTASILSGSLSPHGYTAEQVLDKSLDFGRDPAPNAILLSVVDSGMSGLDVLVSARKAVPPIPVIVLVAPDQTRIAVEALKLGATDALVMPVDDVDLNAALRAVRPKEEASAKPRLVFPQQTAADTAVFISRSPRMLEIWSMAATVARTDLPVMILGESGVGKEVVARFIHRHSRRADKPMVRVNCAALPNDLLESELFGYERGAFTGAVGEKPGKFELADKGCIVLDEIGEMPPNLQAKLLHVLEDGEFSKLGGKRPIKVDVRVLAMTNRRLDEAIPRGEFREDLYFRLNVVKISIPPLRERKEDIPVLAAYFLKRHREALASSLQELPPALLDVFMRYHWPGNVRQLENAIRRYLILPEVDLELNPAVSNAMPIRPSFHAVAAAAAEPVPVSAPVIQFPVPTDSVSLNQFPSPTDSVSLKQIASNAAERAEREMVMHVLQQTKWNRSKAARRLNICYRALLNKLKKWDMNQPRAS
jgi:two-component system response regulator AtoC